MANFNQRLSREIEPDDPTWAVASASRRVLFFREAADRAVALKRAELSRGIGANGRRMPARRRPRPDGADGPVLTPHGDSSRTARLMAGHGDYKGMTIYWRSGHSGSQKLPWGTILGFHARGEVPGAPPRDVRLSRRGIGQLRREMAAWWLQRHADEVEREQAEKAKAERRQKRSIAAKAGAAARKAQKAILDRYPSLNKYIAKDKF